MTKHLRQASVRLLTASGFFCLFALAGCVPVIWLPDSSGFVYCEGGNAQRIVFYDVKKSERRVVVEKTPASTPWPAVSPDGKKIAVARLIRDKDQRRTQSMQVYIYDLQGNEIHRSPELNWTKTGDDGNTDLMITGVYWSPSNGKLIVHDFEDRGKTGVYDPANKTLVTVEGLAAAFGGTPIRPDGKGFLVTRKQDNSATVFLVDWTGKGAAIDMKPETLDVGDKVTAVQAPWLGTSRWDKNVAVVSHKTFRIRIDTDARKGTLENIPEDEAIRAGKEIAQNLAFAEGGARLRVLVDEKVQKKFQLELVKPGDEKPKVLAQREHAFVLSPSPNGKWIAARSLDDDLDIVLVNSTGEVKEIPGVKD